MVDVDDSFGVPPQRLRVEIDQENLEYHGVQEQTLYDTIEVLLGGTPSWDEIGPGLLDGEVEAALGDIKDREVQS